MKKIVAIGFLFLYCCSKTEQDYYNEVKSMEIASKIYDAYFDKNQKGRYVIIINYQGSLLQLNNTFLPSASLKIKRGDSIYKPCDTMKYYVYREGKVTMFEHNAVFK